MKITISEFVQNLKAEAFAFERFWIKMHSVNPEQYPLFFDDENIGIWDEMFNCYVEYGE